MSHPSRRALLCGVSGLFVVAAGCLDTLDGSGDDTNGTNDGGEDENVLVDHDSLNFQHSAVPTDPDAALFLDVEDADEWLAERGLDEGSSAAHFAGKTSFDESVLVALEADAPTPCHRLALETVDVEDEALVVDAAVRDESDDDEECPQQEVTVCVFVRATFADEPVTELSARIVDRDGVEHGIGIGVDSERDERPDEDDANA